MIWLEGVWKWSWPETRVTWVCLTEHWVSSWSPDENALHKTRLRNLQPPNTINYSFTTMWGYIHGDAPWPVILMMCSTFPLPLFTLDIKHQLKSHARWKSQTFSFPFDSRLCFVRRRQASVLQINGTKLWRMATRPAGKKRHHSRKDLDDEGEWRISTVRICK